MTRARSSGGHRPSGVLRRGLVLALVLGIACTAPEPPRERGDAPGGTAIARQAAAILLQLSAYDYALVGSLNGQRDLVVLPERYSLIARNTVRAISVLAGETTAASADRQGPVRDRMLALADGLVLLGREVTAYADGGDPATFARVISEVAASWQRLSGLASSLPPDEAVARSIARGTSFVVTAVPSKVFSVTIGPYATQAEADAAARRAGQVESVARSAPFVVRVGTYPARPAAEAAAAALVPKGFATSAIAEEPRHTFARSGPAPDVELWREPSRIFDTAGAARRVAIAPGAAWLATGSDDGTVAIFSGQGVLRALPRFNAGVAHLAFSDNGEWLFAGGLTLANIRVPSGVAFGTTVRLPAPATQTLFIPGVRAFAAAAKGPTGQPAGGAGAIAGRAPDGAALAAPFPLATPASGAILAATEAGELFIATAGGGGTDIEILRVGADRAPRGVVRVPGTVRALAVDRTGVRAAALTEQGVIRFEPRDGDPSKTLRPVAPAAAREISFGADGTLYVLEATRLVALDPAGAQRWTVPLTDGRRLVMGTRAIVLDGTERLLAVDGAGVVDDLGVGGTVQDVSVSLDLARVAALVDGRRAVLFTLP